MCINTNSKIKKADTGKMQKVGFSLLTFEQDKVLL